MKLPTVAPRGAMAAVLVAHAIVLAGCATAPLPQPTEVSAIGRDAVLLVGRIELTPPLTAKELEDDPFTAGGALANRAFYRMSRSPDDVDERAMGLGPYINPELDETFFFRIPRELTHAVRGTVYLPKGYEIPLPAFAVDVRESDRAIYMGTLHIERDEFNGIVSAKVSDEYQQALPDFRERFGTELTVRKELAHAIAAAR